MASPASLASVSTQRRSRTDHAAPSPPLSSSTTALCSRVTQSRAQASASPFVLAALAWRGTLAACTPSTSLWNASSATGFPCARPGAACGSGALARGGACSSGSSEEEAENRVDFCGTTVLSAASSQSTTLVGATNAQPALPRRARSDVPPTGTAAAMPASPWEKTRRVSKDRSGSCATRNPSRVAHPARGGTPSGGRATLRSALR